MIGGLNYKTRTRWQIPVKLLDKTLLKNFSIDPENRKIAVLELVALVINVLLFTKENPQDTWIVACCDNTNVLSWIARAKAGPPETRTLLQNFLTHIALEKIQVNFCWIRTDANK